MSQWEGEEGGAGCRVWLCLRACKVLLRGWAWGGGVGGRGRGEPAAASASATVALTLCWGPLCGAMSCIPAHPTPDALPHQPRGALHTTDMRRDRGPGQGRRRRVERHTQNRNGKHTPTMAADCLCDRCYSHTRACAEKRCSGGENGLYRQAVVGKGRERRRTKRQEAHRKEKMLLV